MNNHNIEAFYSLLRAGLWEDIDVNLDLKEKGALQGVGGKEGTYNLSSLCNRLPVLSCRKE